MRKHLVAFVSIATAGLFAVPAADAAARWTCDGPAYVCGGASSSAAKSSDASERRSNRSERQTKAAPAPRRQQTASVDRPARPSRSYSGGSDGGGSSFSGRASYYWQPQALASGGRFNPNGYTAAHKTLPFGTRVQVTNQSNGKSVEVVINDRGPYVAGRVIDLSKAAAGAINMQGAGVAPVSVRVLGRS
jgi:rare lipoprotein A